MTPDDYERRIAQLERELAQTERTLIHVASWLVVTIGLMWLMAVL
jgi:hypothetical protein